MHRVLRVLCNLEPVAGVVKRIWDHQAVLIMIVVIGVEDGKIRQLIGRPHERKYNSLVLFDRVGAVAKLLVIGIFRAIGRLEDRAIGRIVPPVIATPDPPVGGNAVFQRRAPMRTVFFNQSYSAFRRSEENQLFSQDLDQQREVLDFLG